MANETPWHCQTILIDKDAHSLHNYLFQMEYFAHSRNLKELPFLQAC